MFADEMAVPGTTISDIDMFLLKNFYEHEDGVGIDTLDLPLGEMLDNLKLKHGENLTLAGVLLFGEHPEYIRPQFVVKAVAFLGNDLDGNEYIDVRTFPAPWPSFIRTPWGF